MKRTYNIEQDPAVSEMAIVDTFTKLIFGDESPYSNSEQRIIGTLREVDVNAAGGRGDLGAYLRALGVEEMIELVGAVRTGMGLTDCPNLQSPSSKAGIQTSAPCRAH